MPFLVNLKEVGDERIIDGDRHVKYAFTCGDKWVHVWLNEDEYDQGGVEIE